MGVNILEYWRGVEENRPLIGRGNQYGPLDPEAFYLGVNCDVDGDQVGPEDLDERKKQTVMTYDSPWAEPVPRDLYVGEYCGILMEVLDEQGNRPGTAGVSIPR